MDDPAQYMSLSSEDQAKCIVIQHALANSVVGLFAASLRFARLTASNYLIGLPEPPSSIPFAEVMDLPIPFSSNSLERFGACHLPIMADPSYLTQGEWTGCINSCGDYGDLFNCIGGPYHDGYSNSVTGASELAGSFPHGRAFERVVRF
jgi:hypothetical protein